MTIKYNKNSNGMDNGEANTLASASAYFADDVSKIQKDFVYDTLRSHFRNTYGDVVSLKQKEISVGDDQMMCGIECTLDSLSVPDFSEIFTNIKQKLSDRSLLLPEDANISIADLSEDLDAQVQMYEAYSESKPWTEFVEQNSLLYVDANPLQKLTMLAHMRMESLSEQIVKETPSRMDSYNNIAENSVKEHVQRIILATLIDEQDSLNNAGVSFQRDDYGNISFNQMDLD